jgi:hypothetical protein
MAYDKSFAQFQFVVSRSFFEKSHYRVTKWRFLTTPAELSRCLRHHAGARLYPQDQPQRFGLSASPELPSLSRLKTKAIAIKHGIASRRLKFGAWMFSGLSRRSEA